MRYHFNKQSYLFISYLSQHRHSCCKIFIKASNHITVSAVTKMSDKTQTNISQGFYVRSCHFSLVNTTAPRPSRMFSAERVCCLYNGLAYHLSFRQNHFRAISSKILWKCSNQMDARGQKENKRVCP